MKPTSPSAAKSPASEPSLPAVWLQFSLPGSTELHRRELDTFPFVIGRGESCNLTVDSACVSRQHACIERQEHGFVLRDMGSTNGTKCNDSAIKSVALQHGDAVGIANLQLIFCTEELAPAAAEGTLILDDTNGQSGLESDPLATTKLTRATQEWLLTGLHAQRFWPARIFHGTARPLFIAATVERQAKSCHNRLLFRHYLHGVAVGCQRFNPGSEMVVAVTTTEAASAEFIHWAASLRDEAKHIGSWTALLADWQVVNAKELDATVGQLTDVGWCWAAGDVEQSKPIMDQLTSLPPNWVFLSERFGKTLPASGERGKQIRECLASFHIAGLRTVASYLEQSQQVEAAELVGCTAGFGQAIAPPLLSDRIAGSDRTIANELESILKNHASYLSQEVIA